MPTYDELKSIDINDWREFGGSFDNADILLGNGFSINFHNDFRYGSLFDRFLDNCDTADADIFRQFGTTNFELIQEKLTATKSVNNILGLPDDGIDNLVDKLKNGLVATIEQSHPRFADIDEDVLWHVCKQLAPFNDIFTANYDLFLYHIIMLFKDWRRANNAIRPYNDYYWRHHDDEFLQFMNFQGYQIYKHVYYLHGALFLFDHPFLDLKIKRPANIELIEQISRKIRAGWFPLFVSEGTAEDKLAAISRSNYLRFALTKLEGAMDNMVIYGMSFSDPDQHILDAIDRKTRNIAVSLHVGNKPLHQLRQEVYRLKAKLNKHQVVVYDSSTHFNFTPVA